MTALFPHALTTFALVALSCGAAQAQDFQRTDDRFCQQYASTTAAVAQEAIDQNPNCLDFSRGVHGVYQMHYDWCMQNTRDEVWGAADHIRNLAAECTTPFAPPMPAAPAWQPQQSAPVGPTQTYAQLGAWEILQWAPGSCSALLMDWSKPEGAGRLLRFDAGPEGFMVVSDQWSDTSPAAALIDGQFYPMVLSQIGEVTTSPIDRSFLAAVQRGNRLNLNFDPDGPEYALSGSSAAIDTMLQCAGMAQPAPAAQPYVLNGTCKLIVDGWTYVDMNGNCPIWMANDGTGSFWINTNRDTYLGDFFAEIVPSGNGFASGHWNAQAGATHAQAPLGEDFRQVGGGCWVNARATVCAAR
ncbi:hypothetical protein C8J27_101819 [Rhodobacter aestuarii]|uniref:YARHG domain-containing protein n=1 Tax=Rhodobacter aestuarii TaxID=453582 RepID=A0A1N7PA64_9RHOB|nr:hypothetical protein [Rhodobacter aestuarii]PTV97701.1 hypothetical protein C8J27_101819 [Rhodobacter aestuarii]SIT07525.1 hypothetical protein SAMN05421580_109179 [Rhodobacter aestuarii]